MNKPKKEPNFSAAAKQRTTRFLEELLSYVLDYGDDPAIKYRWEDEDSNNPKLIIYETPRRFLVKLAKLDKDDYFYEVIRNLIHLEICEDRRTSTQGSTNWHFVLKLWSKDKQKNLREFDKLWEFKEHEKPKKLDHHQTKSKILGKLSQVPQQPLNFLPRPDELNKIKGLLLENENQRVAVTGISHPVGLQGMGGIGKSVLAAILAHDEDIRSVFSDGILWVTLGQQPALTLRQLDLAKMLGDSSQIFQDVQQGKVYLGELLANKACLLIIDDVWKTKDAQAFNILGQRCKMLITTRDSRVLEELGTVNHQLKLLTVTESLALLALWAKQHPETLPTEAHQIVEECGRLPLALAMIGAMLKGKPDRWQNVLNKLQNAELEKIKYQFPDYPYPNLLKAIQVSVEALEPDLQKRYLDFAVFPEDTPIPEVVLQTFWESEGLDKFDTQDVIDLLVERSLIRRDEQNCLTLHDLQYDYVRKQAGDLSILHNRLLAAYSKYCSHGWHTGINDGYFFENLAYHLKESDRKDELYRLLTQSPDWMEAKYIACIGDAAYVADLQLAINDFTDPLTADELLILVQLHTARQLINQRVSLYNNDDLATLVWLDREEEALNHARLRLDIEERFYGLITIYKSLYEKKTPKPEILDEIWEIVNFMDEFRKVEIVCELVVLIGKLNINSDVYKVILSKLMILLSNLLENPNDINKNQLRILNILHKIPDPIQLDQVKRVWDVAILISQIKLEEDIDKKLFSDFITSLSNLLADNYKNISNKDEIYQIQYSEILSKQALLLHFNDQQQLSEPMFNKSHKVIAIYQKFNFAGTNWIPLIMNLIQADYLDKAYRISKNLKENWIKIKTLSNLSEILFNRGMIEKSNLYLTEAENIVLSPDYSIFYMFHWEEEAFIELVLVTATCKGIIKAQKLLSVVKSKVSEDCYSRALMEISKISAQLGDFDKAEELIQEIKNARIKKEAWSSFTLELAKFGYQEKATLLLSNTTQKVLFNKFSFKSALVNLIRLLVQSNLLDIAKITHFIKNNFDQEEILCSQAEILNSLVDSLILNGDLQEAENLSRKITDTHYCSLSLQNIAIELYNQEKMVDANKLINEACKKVSCLEINSDRLFMLIDLAVAYKYLRNIEKANNLFLEIEQILSKENDYESYKVILLNSLVDRIRIAKDKETVNILFNEIEDLFIKQDEYIDSSELIKIIEKLINVGLLNKAHKVTNMIEDLPEKIIALSYVAREFHKHGKFNEAQKILSKAHKVANIIEDLPIEEIEDTIIPVSVLSTAFHNLASVLYQQGKINESTQILSKAYRILSITNDIPGKIIGFFSLVTAFYEQKQDTEAQKIMSTIRENLSLIPKDTDEEDLFNIVARIGKLGKLMDGFNLINIYQYDLDSFIDTLLEWSDAFEKIESGLSLVILKEVIRIASWVSPQWQEIYQIFPDIKRN
jgi:hypothetical protein